MEGPSKVGRLRQVPQSRNNTVPGKQQNHTAVLPGPAPALPVSGLDALTVISADLQDGSEMNMVTKAQRKSSLRSVSENHGYSSCSLVYVLQTDALF